MKIIDRMRENPKTWLLIVLQISTVILSIAVGFFGHYFYLQFFGNLKLLQEAQEIVVNNTINEIPSEQVMEYGMIRGMLNTFNDPYTYFVEPGPNEIQTDELAGSYGGIGARLEQDSSRNWRIYPLPGSPALQAGIKDGDVLVNINDLEITAQVDELTVIAELRGPVGKQVSLTVLRDKNIITFSIKRETFSLPSVTYNLLVEDPHIGLIKINRIAETTTGEIESGIDDLISQGARVFILDLRDNGGGLVEGGIDIVKLFVDTGDIIQREYRDHQPEVFIADGSASYPNVVLVLLINRNTASAAEIVSGALKAHNRAVLVGQPTFGKTEIQYIFDLKDGSSVHVTSGRWWIPGIQFPLVPDTEVEDGATDGEFYLLAKEIFQETLDQP